MKGCGCKQNNMKACPRHAWRVVHPTASATRSFAVRTRRVPKPGGRPMASWTRKSPRWTRQASRWGFRTANGARWSPRWRTHLAPERARWLRWPRWTCVWMRQPLLQTALGHLSDSLAWRRGCQALYAAPLWLLGPHDGRLAQPQVCRQQWTSQTSSRRWIVRRRMPARLASQVVGPATVTVAGRGLSLTVARSGPFCLALHQSWVWPGTPARGRGKGGGVRRFSAQGAGPSHRCQR